MRNSPVTHDELDVLKVELDEIKRRLLRQENDHEPTQPVYLPDIPDDGIDGQFALVAPETVLDDGDEADVQPAWYRGIWRSLTGWRFNFNNQGGSGYVQFNNSTDLDALPDPMSFGGDWGAAFEDDSGDGLAIGSTSVLRLESGGDLALLAGGLITVKLTTGQTVTVFDNTGNPIFRVDEDGDLHGKTGKALTFDL